MAADVRFARAGPRRGCAKSRLSRTKYNARPAQGRRDEVRDLLKPICDSFTDGSDTPDFKAAKELLASPSRSATDQTKDESDF